MMTGLTLPGIIEDPGCTGGSWSSPSPHLGPEASQRRSLQILVSVTAKPLRAALAATCASCPPWAAKWFLASTNES